MAANECLQHLNHVSQQGDPTRLQPYIAAAAQVDLDPYSERVLALLQDPASEHRFVPGAVAGGVVRRLQQVFDAVSVA